MYSVPSMVLRYGVITGLVITLVGVILDAIMGENGLVMIGLMIIDLTPLLSLFMLGILLILRKDIRGFILSQLAIAVILLSILLSLI